MKKMPYDINLSLSTLHKLFWSKICAYSFQSEHGSRISNVRHAGDFGNIEANANGEANIDFSIETGRYLSTLFGENSLVDKSLVIHELEDVFTQPTGAAGSRLACGVLEKSWNN